MSNTEKVAELLDILKQIYSYTVSKGTVLAKYTQLMDDFALKQNLPVDEYITQLEKNVVYNKNLYVYTLMHLVEYISEAQSTYNNVEETYFSIINNAQMNASELTIETLDYLLYGKNVEVSDDIKHLYNLKISQKYSELIDELEFQIQYYKSHYEMVSYFTLQILSNASVIKFMYSNFDKNELTDIFKKSMRDFVNYLFINYQFKSYLT